MSSKFRLKISSLENVFDDFMNRIDNLDTDSRAAINLLDPFAALLESAVFGYKTLDDWKSAETQRSKQKALMNALGNLQQEIIGLLPGWKSYPPGSDMPDVVGRRGTQRVIAEIKNKHNTMNSKSAKATYDSLVEMLERPTFADHTAIVVTVISSKDKYSQEKWRPFAPGRCEERGDLIIMSGRVFYALASDPKCRVPGKTVLPTDPIQNWESWVALDQMIELFWRTVEKKLGYVVPEWIKKISSSTFG